MPHSLTKNFSSYLLFQCNGLDVDSALETLSLSNKIQCVRPCILDLRSRLNANGRRRMNTQELCAAMERIRCSFVVRALQHIEILLWESYARNE